MVQGQAKRLAQCKERVAIHFIKLLQENATGDKAPLHFRVSFESLQHETAARYFSLAVFDQWAAILAAQGVAPPDNGSLQPWDPCADWS